MSRTMLRLFAILLSFTIVAAACGDDGDATTVDDAATDDSSDDSTTDDSSDDSTTDDSATDDAAADDSTDDGSADDDAGYTVRNVPTDYPTVQAGVDAAEPGDLVLINEGIYNEAVIVQTDDIVIRGTDRNAVILDGEYREDRENGIVIFSHGVAVENLTVRNFVGNGIFWTGDYGADILVNGYRGSYLTVHNYGVYGIYATASMNGQLEHSYASGGDDAAYYIGQCKACNALLYEIEGVNSQLGYSGTNSTGVVIANSNFHDNMIGVVPNSQGDNDRAPNAGTTIIGNYIHNNNNTTVASNNGGFRVGFGTGIVLAGTTGNIVDRNLIVDNNRAGVIIVDWIDAIFGSGDEPDYLATDNIVRNNTITGSTLNADLLMALESGDNGGNGTCFSGNTYGVSTPADIESVLGCEGEQAATLTPLTELLEKFDAGFEPIDFRDIPAPEYNFENMPGDPWTDPPVPAHNLPMALDLDAITVPEAG